MTRAPRDIGDKVVISSVADASPKAYPLARIPNNVSYETVTEQPTAEPNQPLTWPVSLHGGLAYSKYHPIQAGMMIGTGLLTHDPGILRAAIATATITLTGAANPVNYFFETVVNDSGADDGQPVLYAIANEAAEINVYKISLDSGDFGTLLNTKTFAITPTQPCGKPAEWNNGSVTRWYIPLGDNGNIQELETIVSSTANDTYDEGSTPADARHLQIVGNQMVRSTDENQVSILARGADPLEEANWGGDFFVGDKSSDITELGEASGLGYIAKEDGFYEWDLVGEADNILPEIGKADRNGQGMRYWHGGFLIPADTGLWWTRTGKPVGPDSNPENRGKHPTLPSGALFIKHGRWQGLAPYGEYIYAMYENSSGSSGTSMFGRERDASDPPGWGPLVWHTVDVPLVEADSFLGHHIARTAEFGASDIRPLLLTQFGKNLRRMWLDRDGAPISRLGDIDVAASEFFASTGDLDFGLPRALKQLQVIEGQAEHFGSVTGSWQFSVERDGSNSEENVGATITADGFFQRFWTQDTNDTARSISLNIKFTGAANLTSTEGPQLKDVVVQAVAVPDVTREWTFLFDVEDDGKTAKKKRSEIEAYVGDLKKYKLPDGDTFNGVMGKVRMLRADEISALTPRNQEPPHYVMAAPVREVSGS